MAARRFRQPPLWDAIEHSVRATDKTADLEVKYINSYKGRGVFAKAPFLKGDFVVEYRGELISSEESQRRRSVYHSRCTVFMFDFYSRDRAWCVDAAQEDGSLGRLVNDDHHNPNCRIKKIRTEGKPRLFLFALKDISAGEEITYEYGVIDCPWRKKAGPQTTISESSEEAPQRPSLYQMKTRTLSSDSEISVAEEDEDSLSGPRTEITQGLQSESESDSDSDELFDNSGDDDNPYSSEDDSDGTDTSDEVEPLSLTMDMFQSLNNGSQKQLPDSASSPLTEAREAAGSPRTATIYNQRQFCLYCKSGVGEIVKHLESSHHNEPDVAQAFSFPKGSKERRMCLEHLTSRGNFAHSVDVSHAGNTRVQPPCAPPSPEVKGELGKLFEDMVQDEVYYAVKSDVCILEYGEDLYNRLKFEDGKKEYVRHKLRELGRLLICSRKTSPMRTIQDHMAPANFMHVVQAVKRVAGFDSATDTYKSPSIALKLGNGLAKIARLVESGASGRHNLGAARDARAFRKVYDKRWHELVSATSLKTLRGMKYSAPLLLSFTQDVQALHCYLDAQQQRIQRDLCRKPTPRMWARLAKVTLTQVHLFNRRKAGEVSKMPLSAYVSPEPQEDADGALLSYLEKKLCRNTRRVEMRGKRGGRIAVLLTPAMQQALDLLVSKRHECKVTLANAYMFARPGAPTCYRGADALRHYARLCGAKSPVSLTCAKLRRQMGTLCLVLNLGTAELDQLADLLGHDVRAHRQFFRLPEGTLQLAKISKVLMDLDRGRLAEFKGKSLEDISIEPDENVQMDSGNEVAYESDSQDSQITSSQREEDADLSHRYRGKKRGRLPLKRSRWLKEEVLAVEKHLMSFITSRRVPGKSECEQCLRLETVALRNRRWNAVKFYVNNRIQSHKRKALRLQAKSVYQVSPYLL